MPKAASSFTQRPFAWAQLYSAIHELKRTPAIDSTLSRGALARDLSLFFCDFAFVRLGAGLGTVVFVELVSEGTNAHAKQLGGVSAIAFAMLKRGKDVTLFHLLQARHAPV